MEYNEVIVWLQQTLPPILVLILSLLGSLVMLGVAYVAMTPSQDDDAWLLALQEKPLIGHLLKFLQAFSMVEKKDGKLQLSNKKEVPELPPGAPKA
jgi:hypothetical protein